MKYKWSYMGHHFVKLGKNNYRTVPQNKPGTTHIIYADLIFKYYVL